ncbi:MAG: hypothetical protein N3E45_03215 [Oscillatoriaceae bacterium SKW80]|nr:hypothetical protein [Oscillatoriaceae bacterium SKYG93]MCX8119830.1 hypothetical protein [Oscillatoriaceae bacterium SKW80]MDW8452064.1 hypothetical protein [Oscillatoriaceae cyanobacterium SKYGB_i_bin93]HIK27496.1 hypothetical protein [Oscillatoriaceae cyanobacterium M7585_C2015_266]
MAAIPSKNHPNSTEPRQEGYHLSAKLAITFFRQLKVLFCSELARMETGEQPKKVKLRKLLTCPVVIVLVALKI